MIYNLSGSKREELSGGRQKSYLATAIRFIWRPPEEKSYLAAREKRRLIRWLPEENSYPAVTRREELSGGRQKSYEGQ